MAKRNRQGPEKAGYGNVVQLPLGLSTDEKAAIDADLDPMKGADFDTVASSKDRASFVLGAIHMIATTRADPDVIFKQMTNRMPPEAIDRNRKEFEHVVDLLSQILGGFDGRPA